MKNRFFRLLIAAFTAIVFITACSEDTAVTPTIDEGKLVVNYLETNNDYINSAAPALISASDLKTAITANASDVLLIDIRSAADFAKGHIAGANNVEVSKVLEFMAANNAKNFGKVVVVCYSGQTASYVTSILRIDGYPNVTALKWGMASWSTDSKATWAGKIGNSKATMFVSTETVKPAATQLPALTTGKTTAQDIIDARAKQLLADDFTPAKITADDVFANPSNYFIINYWPANHYADPGHIPGAMQYTPKADLKFDTYLRTLPLNKTIVVYCYTGQTSAAVTAYLRLLGYDAKSLLYGTNGMIYDMMQAKGLSIWSDTQCAGYDVVK